MVKLDAIAVQSQKTRFNARCKGSRGELLVSDRIITDRFAEETAGSNNKVQLGFFKHREAKSAGRVSQTLFVQFWKFTNVQTEPNLMMHHKIVFLPDFTQNSQLGKVCAGWGQLACLIGKENV